MEKVQIWRPDTCRCVIEEIVEDGQIKRAGNVIRKCGDHEEVPDEDLYGVLYANPDGENKVKNLVHSMLLGYDEVKDLGIEKRVKDKDGAESIQLDDGVKYNWRFTGKGKNRKLVFSVDGATIPTQKKGALRALCDRKFGTGRVEME